MKRLLVVDDNPEMRTTLRKTLERAGYHVSLARDGAEALDRLVGGSFDLILTDYQMPRLDGLELARELGRRFPGGVPPVILMTAHGDVDHYLDAMSLGIVQEYVNKPVDRSELLLIIDGVLHGHGRKERHSH